MTCSEIERLVVLMLRLEGRRLSTSEVAERLPKEAEPHSYNVAEFLRKMWLQGKIGRYWGISVDRWYLY
jgi:hypothetical protein